MCACTHVWSEYTHTIIGRSSLYIYLSITLSIFVFKLITKVIFYIYLPLPEYSHFCRIQSTLNIWVLSSDAKSSLHKDWWSRFFAGKNQHAKTILVRTMGGRGKGKRNGGREKCYYLTLSDCSCWYHFVNFFFREIPTIKMFHKKTFKVQK